MGQNHHEWDTKCFEGQPAVWPNWTGILINVAVRMSNLMTSYVVFAISGFCFCIKGYLCVFLFFSQAFPVCVFDISSYSVLFLISELVLTLDWLCCSVSFVCITYCIVQSSLYLSTRIKDLNSSQDMEFHICVTL